MADPRHRPPPLCPSAQPHQDDAVLLGVVGGEAADPRLAYVRGRHPVTDELVAMAGPVGPTEVFRFAAPCAQGGCQHFDAGGGGEDDGGRCRLGDRIVTHLPPVIERLPTCSIRPDCRWWREQGSAACRRCPGIVTDALRPSEQLADAARPRPADG
jgi:hypothetical protein